MHILQRIDYVFKREDQEELFDTFSVTASPLPARSATFRDTMDDLARIIESLVFEGARIPAPKGGVCAVDTLTKKRVYKEGFSEIEGGFQYQGECTVSLAPKTVWRPLSLSAETKSRTAHWALALRGTVHRWGHGTVDAAVTLHMFAHHTINLALLDRILADPKFTVSPGAQEALTRIAALRAGQGSTDPNEWVALLKSSGSYPDSLGVSSNRGEAK